MHVKSKDWTTAYFKQSRKNLSAGPEKVSSLTRPALVNFCGEYGNPFVCADDEHQRIIQLELNYSGFAAVGTSIREINYPDGVSSIDSLCARRRSAYLAASGKAGGWWVIRL